MIHQKNDTKCIAFGCSSTWNNRWVLQTAHIPIYYHLVFMSFCPPKTIEILKSCDIITFLYSNYCQYVWFEYYFLTSVNLLNNSQNMQGLCKLFDKA